MSEVHDSESSTGSVGKPPTKRNKVWYQQAFRSEWLKDKELKDWLKEDPNDKYAALCSLCNCKLKNCNKSDLIRHVASKKHEKHKNNPMDKNDTIKIQYFLKRPTEPRHKEKIENAERLLTGFIAEQQMPSSQADQLVQMIKKMFPDNITAQSMTPKTTKLPHINEEGTSWQSRERQEANMSRHVPLTCRDPFFRDLDRDFFGDRSSRKNWFDSSPSKLFDQHFGVGLWPDDVQTGTSSLYLRSRRPPRERSGVSYVDNVREKLSIMLDVPHFTPDELKVRVTGNTLEVEGKHEDRQDEHGTVFRHFVRKYVLPDDVMVDMIASSLSADGVLTVEAPKKPPEPPRPTEREVPIQKMEKGAKNEL